MITNHYEPLTPEQRQTLYAHHRQAFKVRHYLWSRDAEEAALARIQEIVRLPDGERIALTTGEAGLLGYNRFAA